MFLSLSPLALKLVADTNITDVMRFIVTVNNKFNAVIVAVNFMLVIKLPVQVLTFYRRKEMTAG